ncbi:hypothetical protein B484DRAFT_472685, partial [Ochromonadaceae sp. CCMP2298]
MSSSVLPAVFQTWSEDTAQLFKSRNLFKFLTGETPSEFDEPKPRFRWQLETEIEAGIKTDSGGGAKKDLQREFQGAAAQVDDTPAAATLGGSPLITEIGVFTSPEAETQGLPSGARRVTAVSSPDSDYFLMADVLQTTGSVDFYYRRAEAHIKAEESWTKREQIHDHKHNLGQDLLMSTLSTSVKRTFKDEIPTRRLDYIWAKIHEKCGPRSSTEGLAELNKSWTNFSIGPKEDMTDMLQCLEREASKFDAYGDQWLKSDVHLIVQVRVALGSDIKNWPEWKREWRESDRLGEDWSALKTRLEKLAGEIRADDATSKVTKTPSRFEKAAAAKAEKEASSQEKAAASDRTCPWTTQFKEMKAASLENQGKTEALGKSKATVDRSSKPNSKEKVAAGVEDAQDSDSESEDERGCAARAHGGEEAFDDWLAGSKGESMSTAIAGAVGAGAHIVLSALAGSVRTMTDDELNAWVVSESLRRSADLDAQLMDAVSEGGAELTFPSEILNSGSATAGGPARRWHESGDDTSDGASISGDSDCESDGEVGMGAMSIVDSTSSSQLFLFATEDIPVGDEMMTHVPGFFSLGGFAGVSEEGFARDVPGVGGLAADVSGDGGFDQGSRSDSSFETTPEDLSRSSDL